MDKSQFYLVHIRANYNDTFGSLYSLGADGDVSKTGHFITGV